MIIKIIHTEKLSYSIVGVLILVSLIPTTTMISFNSHYAWEYIIGQYVYWLSILSLNILSPKILILNNLTGSKNIYKIILIVLSATVIFMSWYFTGFRLHFDIYEVYDVRAEARGYQVPLIVGYLSTFADNLLPIMLVYCLYRRNYKLALFIATMIFLNFGITATKQILFLLFFALIGFYIVKSYKMVKYYVHGLIGVILLSFLETKIFSTYFVSIFFQYRILFIPSKLHYVYYDFFKTRELDYFRQSALKYFFSSPYKENLGFILGDHDIGNIEARANNGLFSDAYLNVGIIGVVIFPVILVAVLKILEGSTKGLNERMLFILTTSVSFVLLGLPLTTALFSAGIIIMIIFMYSLPRETIFKQ